MTAAIHTWPPKAIDTNGGGRIVSTTGSATTIELPLIEIERVQYGDRIAVRAGGMVEAIVGQLVRIEKFYATSTAVIVVDEEA